MICVNILPPYVDCKAVDGGFPPQVQHLISGATVRWFLSAIEETRFDMTSAGNMPGADKD